MAGLCSLANVKLVIFPTGYTDTTDDAIIQSYIDGFTAEAQEYTARQFVGDTIDTDYYFDVVRQGRSLYLPNGAQSVTSVGYAKTSQPASGGTYTTITAANILLRPLVQDRRPGFPADSLMISDLDPTSYFYYGYNTVKVTMKAGFAAVPNDIERVAVAVVVRRWQARKGGQADLIGDPTLGGSLLRFMSGEEKGVLDRYSDPTVG